MKSIKPGRGPSAMGAFGAAAVSIFGVFWTIGAASAGAPGFFVAFGVVFVLLGIGQAVYNFQNATGKNRFSEYDITDEKEESDPFNEYVAKENDRDTDNGYANAYTTNLEDHGMTTDAANSNTKIFCPYCGAKAEPEFSYCTKCGKKLPE